MKKIERRKNRLKQLLLAKQKQLIEELRAEWNESEKTKIKKERREHTKEIIIDSGKIIFALLLVGGVLAVASVAPNVFTVFGRRGKKAYFNKNIFEKKLAYLRKKKLIETEKYDDENYMITLTKSGREQTLIPSFEEICIPKQEKWDEIWRVVFFDIPEEHKWERECFRNRLEKMGFYHLQKSVFVHPFPCRREVEFITSLFGVRSCVHFIETQSPFNEMAELYTHFNLLEKGDK